MNQKGNVRVLKLVCSGWQETGIITEKHLMLMEKNVLVN
jgi:hypothetical protein